MNLGVVDAFHWQLEVSCVPPVAGVGGRVWHLGLG